MRFVLEQVLDAPAGWREIPAFAELEAEIAREVLEQAARFTEDVLAPLNSPADLEGCHWGEAGVQTPQGYPGGLASLCGRWLAFLGL